jgi:hypothetical protein
VTHVVLVYQIFGINATLDSFLEGRPSTGSRMLCKHKEFYGSIENLGHNAKHPWFAVQRYNEVFCSTFELYLLSLELPVATGPTAAGSSSQSSCRSCLTWRVRCNFAATFASAIVSAALLCRILCHVSPCSAQEDVILSSSSCSFLLGKKCIPW